MSCEKSLELVSSVLDGRLSAGEREKAMAHVESCPACSSEFNSLFTLRQDLKALKQPTPPEWLGAKLQVMASHELQRRMARENLSVRLSAWAGRVRLSFDNMMKPMALPFAGGLVSALLLFGAVVQQAFPAHFRDDVATNITTDPDGQIEIPTVMSTDTKGNDIDLTPRAGWMIPRFEPVNADVTDAGTLAELTISPDGIVGSYRVVRGDLTREMKEFILWSKFTPATIFGKPAWGKKLVLFRHVDSARS